MPETSFESTGRHNGRRKHRKKNRSLIDNDPQMFQSMSSLSSSSSSLLSPGQSFSKRVNYTEAEGGKNVLEKPGLEDSFNIVDVSFIRRSDISPRLKRSLREKVLQSINILNKKDTLKISLNNREEENEATNLKPEELITFKKLTVWSHLNATLPIQNIEGLYSLKTEANFQTNSYISTSDISKNISKFDQPNLNKIVGKMRANNTEKRMRLFDTRNCSNKKGKISESTIGSFNINEKNKKIIDGDKSNFLLCSTEHNQKFSERLEKFYKSPKKSFDSLKRTTKKSYFEELSLTHKDEPTKPIKEINYLATRWGSGNSEINSINFRSKIFKFSDKLPTRKSFNKNENDLLNTINKKETNLRYIKESNNKRDNELNNKGISIAVNTSGNFILGEVKEEGNYNNFHWNKMENKMLFNKTDFFHPNFQSTKLKKKITSNEQIVNSHLIRSQSRIENKKHLNKFLQSEQTNETLSAAKTNYFSLLNKNINQPSIFRSKEAQRGGKYSLSYETLKNSKFHPQTFKSKMFRQSFLTKESQKVRQDKTPKTSPIFLRNNKETRKRTTNLQIKNKNNFYFKSLKITNFSSKFQKIKKSIRVPERKTHFESSNISSLEKLSHKNGSFFPLQDDSDLDSILLGLPSDFSGIHPVSSVSKMTNDGSGLDNEEQVDLKIGHLSESLNNFAEGFSPKKSKSAKEKTKKTRSKRHESFSDYFVIDKGGCLQYQSESLPGGAFTLSATEAISIHEAQLRHMASQVLRGRSHRRRNKVHVVETVATIVVKDINDNAPIFPNMTVYGEVQENGPIGEYLLMF